MGNKNRKASKSEMHHISSIIKEAFPGFIPIFGGHGNYGGHRAPRDHTISFRLRGSDGKFHSNVVWLIPNYLMRYTITDIQKMVGRGQGK
jgi:hypothetical protein